MYKKHHMRCVDEIMSLATKTCQVLLITSAKAGYIFTYSLYVGQFACLFAEILKRTLIYEG